MKIKLAAEESEPEKKIDFSLDGEAPVWIGLDEARIRAMEHARDHTDFSGPKYAGVNFVFEFRSSEETEDYYEINLFFRPAGRWEGERGLVQFIFDKTGELRMRQLFDEPMAMAVAEVQEERAPEPLLETVTPPDRETQLEPETDPITQGVETVDPPITTPEHKIAQPTEEERDIAPAAIVEPVGSPVDSPVDSTELAGPKLDVGEPLRPPQLSAVNEDNNLPTQSNETNGLDLESLLEALEAFENRVVRLKAVKKELKSLDTRERAQADHGLIGILKSPDMVEEAEARLAALKHAMSLDRNN